MAFRMDRKTLWGVAALFIGLSFGVQADGARMQAFTDAVQEKVTDQNLRLIAMEAGKRWTQTIEIYNGNAPVPDAQTARHIVARLVAIDLCLSDLHSKSPDIPNIKDLYFPSLEDAVLSVQVANNMAQFVGDEDFLMEEIIAQTECEVLVEAIRKEG